MSPRHTKLARLGAHTTGRELVGLPRSPVIESPAPMFTVSSFGV
jgi:hypothetical protein